MFIPAQNLLRWKVAITALHGLATLTTCLRLEHRRRTRRLWWDDRAAVVPAVVQVLNVVVLWLRLRGAPMPVKEKVLYSYANSFCFATITWWSRISLSLAVVRITPAWSTSRRLAICMTTAFVLFWIALVLGMIVTCSVHTQWQYVNPNLKRQILICGPAFHVTVASTVLDITSDISLIAIPLHQLWRMTHPASQRRLRIVRLLFSASVLTLLGSVVLCVVSYAEFIAGPGRMVVWLMMCHVAEALSMITSNLLVLICWFRHQVLKETGAGSMDVGDVYVRPHWGFNSRLDSRSDSGSDSNLDSNLEANYNSNGNSNSNSNSGSNSRADSDSRSGSNSHSNTHSNSHSHSHSNEQGGGEDVCEGREKKNPDGTNEMPTATSTAASTPGAHACCRSESRSGGGGGGGGALDGICVHVKDKDKDKNRDEDEEKDKEVEVEVERKITDQVNVPVPVLAVQHA